MNHNKCGHRHDRGIDSFETHERSNAARRGGQSVRKGAAWRFYAGAYFCDGLPERHWRAVARTPALPGKHIRPAGESISALHGKNL